MMYGARDMVWDGRTTDGRINRWMDGQTEKVTSGGGSPT